MKLDKRALWEAVKEPLRWLVLSVIPFGISYFISLDYQWAAMVVVLLRIVDGYLHQQAPDGASGGLTRF